MSSKFTIRKGLNIKLSGESDLILKNAPRSEVYSICPPEFHRISPKLLKKEGERVKVGSPIFFSKENKEIVFSSPVSGEIVNIVRGEKRKILEIHILPDKKLEFESFQAIDPKTADEKAIKELLLNAGCWPFIKQRPYDVIANPSHRPKAIFISAIHSAPLKPELDFVLNGKQKEIEAASTALQKLADHVHVTVPMGLPTVFSKINGLEVHEAKGLHPVGNVSTQIAKIDPIDKGEIVWVISPEDLVIMGHLILHGEFKAERIIAVSGSEVRNPHYVQASIGSKIKDILKVTGVSENKLRIIQGNVLSGQTTSMEGFLGYYSNQLTVIPEGDYYDFFGWQLPQLNKFSVLRANMFSFLSPNKKYALDSNMNGEHRAFVLTGQFEKVVPLDIYPMHFLKACMAKDIDELEALGIYEVAPEDFALTEFIDISKNEHQKLVRESLDLMIEEVGI